MSGVWNRIPNRCKLNVYNCVLISGMGTRSPMSTRIVQNVADWNFSSIC